MVHSFSIPMLDITRYLNHQKTHWFSGFTHWTLAIFHYFFYVYQRVNPMFNPMKPRFSYGFPMVFLGQPSKTITGTVDCACSLGTETRPPTKASRSMSSCCALRWERLGYDFFPHRWGIKGISIFQLAPTIYIYICIYIHICLGYSNFIHIPKRFPIGKPVGATNRVSQPSNRLFFLFTKINK